MRFIFFETTLVNNVETRVYEHIKSRFFLTKSIENLWIFNLSQIVKFIVFLAWFLTYDALLFIFLIFLKFIHFFKHF